MENDLNGRTLELLVSRNREITDDLRSLDRVVGIVVVLDFVMILLASVLDDFPAYGDIAWALAAACALLSLASGAVALCRYRPICHFPGRDVEPGAMAPGNILIRMLEEVDRDLRSNRKRHGRKTFAVAL
jgi:hypothetical protein